MTPIFMVSAVNGFFFNESNQRGKEPRGGVVAAAFSDKDLPHTKCCRVDGDPAG